MIKIPPISRYHSHVKSLFRPSLKNVPTVGMKSSLAANIKMRNIEVNVHALRKYINEYNYFLVCLLKPSSEIIQKKNTREKKLYPVIKTVATNLIH